MGGFFFDFELFRTASGPLRRVRESLRGHRDAVEQPRCSAQARSSETPLFVVQADRAYDVSSSASAGARMDAALWNAASMDE